MTGSRNHLNERTMSRERFVERMGEAVVSLPYDLKAMLRVVEDAEVEPIAVRQRCPDLGQRICHHAALHGVTSRKPADHQS